MYNLMFFEIVKKNYDVIIALLSISGLTIDFRGVFIVILDQRKIFDRVKYKISIFEQLPPMIFHCRKPEIVPLPVNCQKTPGLKFFLMDQ